MSVPIAEPIPLKNIFNSDADSAKKKYSFGFCHPVNTPHRRKTSNDRNKHHNRFIDKDTHLLSYNYLDTGNEYYCRRGILS